MSLSSEGPERTTTLSDVDHHLSTGCVEEVFESVEVRDCSVPHERDVFRVVHDNFGSVIALDTSVVVAVCLSIPYHVKV